MSAEEMRERAAEAQGLPNLTDWEEDFLEQMSEITYAPTDRQIEKLVQIEEEAPERFDR